MQEVQFGYENVSGVYALSQMFSRAQRASEVITTKTGIIPVPAFMGSNQVGIRDYAPEHIPLGPLPRISEKAAFVYVDTPLENLGEHLPHRLKNSNKRTFELTSDGIYVSLTTQANAPKLVQVHARIEDPNLSDIIKALDYKDHPMQSRLSQEDLQEYGLLFKKPSSGRGIPGIFEGI